MNLHLEVVILFLCVLWEAFSARTQGYQKCFRKSNDRGIIPCEVSVGSSDVCFVCPILRTQTGLSWRRSTRTLFIETVRISKELNTYAVNECGSNNYTLSVSSNNDNSSDTYTCTLGNATLAQFDLILIDDLKPVAHERHFCAHLLHHKGDIPCEALLGSSPTCLVCPIKSNEHSSLSWTYADNVTLFRSEVRVGKFLNTSVNQCDHENYTLSVSPTSFSDGGHYSCSLGGKTLARFNVTVVAAISQIYLRCNNTKGHCTTKLQFNASMVFECCVLRPHSPFTLSWFVDERIVHSTHYEAMNESSVPSNVTSSFHYKFIGTERSVSCEVSGSRIARTKETFHFSPIQKVTPELLIFWKDTVMVNSVEVNINTTVEAHCEASNVNLPVTLAWEIDDQEIFSEEIYPWSTKLKDEHHEKNKTNGTNGLLNKLTLEFRIYLNFTPTDSSHTIACVCKGPLIFGRKRSVQLLLKDTISEDKHLLYSPVTWAVVLLPVVSLLVFCLVSLKKAVFPEKKVVSSSDYSERFTETAQPQQNHEQDETCIGERTPDYDIYFGTDNSESLSNFVRLINRISENGRLERWVGEMSGMVCDSNNCVASTYKDDASERNIAEFRTLAMHVKDLVDHENVVEIIGIEIVKEPFFIYTEYIEMGTLKDFLNELQSTKVDPNSYLHELLRLSQEVSSALVYLKSTKLSHPAICCEKVLLTEGGVCKIYDLQCYPLSENVIFDIVLKHENLSSNWKVAPETRLKKEHSYQSDSWSLSAFICEVYTMGTDPCKAARNSLYEVPANYYDVSFRRPYTCPDSLYSVLKCGWNIDKNERPDIETIYKSLVATTY